MKEIKPRDREADNGMIRTMLLDETNFLKKLA